MLSEQLILKKIFTLNTVKLTTTIALLLFLNIGTCYGASKDQKAPEAKTPKDGQMFYGALPSYYTQPKYQDIAIGYSGNNIMGINKTEKSIMEWVYDEKYSALGKIQKNVSKSCGEKGYNIGASSNIKVDLDQPLDSLYMITYTYEINCW